MGGIRDLFLSGGDADAHLGARERLGKFLERGKPVMAIKSNPSATFKPCKPTAGETTGKNGKRIP
jgi:hypothetical protein